MCDVCGCDDHRHHDHHHHDHVHGHDHSHRNETIPLETRIVAKNDALALGNRRWLAERGVFALNLMGAPGSGKTTLLERTVGQLPPDSLMVIEGDQATENDAARVRAAGARVVQINTGAGCHLDADMVAKSLASLAPQRGATVVIENVGNLVCPALFDLGEQRRVVVLSVAEGDDKPLKYPHMFRAADLIVLNKVDLLPHVEFDIERATANARALKPGVEVLQVSAKTGEGLARWTRWLRAASIQA